MGSVRKPVKEPPGSKLVIEMYDITDSISRNIKFPGNLLRHKHSPLVVGTPFKALKLK